MIDDAVVTSPWFAALDLALPLLVHNLSFFLSAVDTVACIHVPGHYFTSAVEPRPTCLPAGAAGPGQVVYIRKPWPCPVGDIVWYRACPEDP
jgi:hypothetical protein